MKWQPFPMIRIAGFFSGGVLLGIYFPILVYPRVAAVSVLFCTALFFLSKVFLKAKAEFYTGCFGLVLIFFLGYSRSIFFADERRPGHISKMGKIINAYEAVVRGVPEEKSKSWKIEIEIVNVNTGSWHRASGRVLLYLSRKVSSPPDFYYGDKILVKGNPKELKPPANPEEFDFKRFLHFKNISHQHFISQDHVKLVERNVRKGLVYYSHLARSWCSKRITQFVSGDDERGIAIALVLGVTDGIDNDLQNAYAASGAMHVLAVSGMHVGIIYAIILFLFSPVERLKNGRWIVAVVSLMCLWIFSFVTGNSPSVLRAVTMFSFIAFARPLGWKTNIYNTLAASAFALLIYDPFMIMSVGFQLSYLAVLGIVLLQRPLYQLWGIENFVGDWIWKITVVSIAAQAATFALGLLYFHQFPTYFLISNLFVIPLSTLVLLGGILLLVVSFFSPLANLVGVILQGLIKGLNWIVFKTESLPMSLIDNIHISVFQCWLLVAILIAIVVLLKFKSATGFYVAFVLVTIFSISQWIQFKGNVAQQQMITYSVNGHPALEFIENGRSFFASDSSLLNNYSRMKLHVLPNRLKHGVRQVSQAVPFSTEVNGVTFFKWKGKSVAWMNEKNQFAFNARLDYLIVSRNSLSEDQLARLSVKQVIFDGSNSNKYVKEMQSAADSNGISTYYVLQRGAFIIQ